jgi:hypothetical protein
MMLFLPPSEGQPRQGASHIHPEKLANSSLRLVHPLWMGSIRQWLSRMSPRPALLVLISQWSSVGNTCIHYSNVPIQCDWGPYIANKTDIGKLLNDSQQGDRYNRLSHPSLDSQASHPSQCPSSTRGTRAPKYSTHTGRGATSQKPFQPPPFPRFFEASAAVLLL